MGALTDQLIALRYPNGRVYETVLDRKVRFGEQFEMYGRTWTPMRTKTSRLYKGRPRTLCVPADSPGVLKPRGFPIATQVE